MQNTSGADDTVEQILAQQQGGSTQGAHRATNQEQWEISFGEKYGQKDISV